MEMYNRIRIGFLLLIIFQGFHSIEEYCGRLWDVLTPARIVSGAVSSNLEVGFVLINISLFIFGVMCWLISTRQKRISYQGFIWIWILIEVLNGIGHPLLALNRHSYYPGLLTSPFLLILSLYLGWQLLIYNGFSFSRANKDNARNV